MTKIRTSSRFQRLRIIERLQQRTLFAADLTTDLVPLTIPLEPADLVQQDQEYYASFNSAAHPPQTPLADTFKLHSRPTATKTIYLDFDGNTTVGTSWNRAYNVATINSPAYDPDNNGPSFTNAELTRIQGIWQRVATDFAPFDVNVTTEDPGEAALVNTGGSDNAWGIRVVTTVDNFAASGAGGFAYINSFNWGYESTGATDTPCYIFNTTEVSVAAAITHEVGHALGLAHDGTNSSHPTQPNAAYYNGHGSGENSWGPSMGVGGYYANVTTWDQGEYFGANNIGAGANYNRGPDDIAIITGFNGFGVIPDDHGNSAASSSTVNYLSVNATNPNLIDVSLFGTIETRTDIDGVRFETGTGVVNLTIDPYVSELWIPNASGSYDRSLVPAYYGTSWANNQGSNLDVSASLLDAAGNVIATSNPAGLRASFTNLALTAGTYYITIDGVGFGTPGANPPTGYTDYGSIGQYLVSGTVTSLGIDVNLGSGSAVYVENAAPVLVSPSATFRDSFGVDYNQLNLTASIVANEETTDRLTILSTGSGVGQISVSNNVVSFGGVPFGSVTQLPTRLTVDLAANANQAAVEALTRSIAFSSVSDGPSTLTRKVELSFGLGVAKSRDVVVVATNDSPSIRNSFMPSVDEDTPTPTGRAINQLLASTFTDPDLGSQLSGIAIVGNTANATTEGTWFYSSNQGSSWSAIGTVNDSSASLLVAATDWLGFLPVPNYFGTPAPLSIRVLDNTFAGLFSNSVTSQRRFLDPAQLSLVNGPVSANPANVVLTVRNINDAPVANVPRVQVNATQDQPLDFTFDQQFPNGIFSDIDSPSLTWSLLPTGLPQLPSWLNFDPVARTLKGTPTNSDVGTLDFQLRATDSSAAAFVPLQLTVANINDAPQILGLSGLNVAENDFGAAVGQISSFDPDLRDSLAFSLSDPRFYVSEGLVLLQSTAFVDFETEPIVQLTITATDNGTPALSSSKTFSITVRDTNEYFPSFSSQSLLIPFVRTNNQLLGTVTATDDDIRQTVKYRIQQDTAGIFEINSINGEVRLKSGAVVTEESYRLFITAYDNGEPSNSRTVLFNVAVEIPNLFAPDISLGRNLTIVENSAPGSLVGRVVGSDRDGDKNLSYSTTSSLFRVDATTGNVTVAPGTNLNFEAQSTYIVSMSITDSVAPVRTGTYPITITLVNANDAPTAIRLVDPKAPTLQKGIELSQILVTDEDTTGQFVFSTNDSRFEFRNGKFALKSNAYFDSLQAGTIATAQVTVTDVNDPTSSATLPLAIDVFNNAFPWQNRTSSLDVNSDGTITALDALLVVNGLNSPSLGRGPLNTPREFSQLSLFNIDTSGDNELSPLDALLVINKLIADRAAGEGESTLNASSESETPSSGSDEAWYDAFSSLEEERRRRK